MQNIDKISGKTKLLTEKDRLATQILDKLSGFFVEQWIEDNTDYAWSFFVNNTLIGYCTTGCADDCPDIIETHPSYTVDSLLISNVFILPEYRHNHFGSQMIVEAIHNRWKSDGERNSVFLQAISESVMQFYEKNGFHVLEDEIMILCP